MPSPSALFLVADLYYHRQGEVSMTKEGFTHKIDDLGRVLVPQALRKELGWEIGDILSLCHVSGTVVLSLEEKINADSEENH